MPLIAAIAIIVFLALTRAKPAATADTAAKRNVSTIPAGKGTSTGGAGAAGSAAAATATGQRVPIGTAKGGSSFNFGAKTSDLFPSGEKGGDTSSAAYQPAGTESGGIPDAGPVGESDLNSPGFGDVGDEETFADPGEAGAFGSTGGFQGYDQSFIDEGGFDTGDFGDFGGFGDPGDFGDVGGDEDFG